MKFLTGEDAAILSFFAQVSYSNLEFDKDILDLMNNLSCKSAIKIAQGIIAKDLSNPAVKEFHNWVKSL